METSSTYFNPLSFAHSHLQYSNEGYSSLPFSLLPAKEGLDRPFTPSSPSLDMEAALQNLSSTCDSELSTTGCLDDPEARMVDSFLDRLNDLLMADQDEDDSPRMRQDVEASYHAIISSLYDIIGECSPLNHTFSGCRFTRESHTLKVSNDFLPDCSGFDVSLEQEKAGMLCSAAEQDIAQNSSYQAYNGPCGTAYVHQCPLVDISFEAFKVKAGYADLYVGKPILSDTSISRSLQGDRKKYSKAASKGRQSGRTASAEVGGPVDLRELLVSCAQVVAAGDLKNGSKIVQELHKFHGVSVNGNGLQRTAHYFCEALLARMEGTGGQQYKILWENTPPDLLSFVRASRIWYGGMAPYAKIMYYFANQNILKAAEGASRLHILDYGIFYGIQWPCLINALADRKGGPPLLVITGIDCSKPGLSSLELLEESGQQLAAYARAYNVPFQFHAIVSDKWEEIDPTTLHLQESEVLVINCMKCLRHYAEESAVDPTLTTSPRQNLLMSMRNLNPHLLLIAEVNSASNSPFFVSRFREALNLYSNVIDMIDTVESDNLDRLFLETRWYASGILNIVACEGAERVERPETYRHWDGRIKRAGFELLPIPSVILSRSRLYVKQKCNEYFIVDEDAKGGWMLLGWKGRTVLSMSAWKPSFNK